MVKPVSESAAERIDRIIEELGDWRGDTLAHVRELVREAVPEATEEVKWEKPTNPLGVPVWSLDGIICTGETYRDKVKVTFMKGAELEDPAGLFNAGLGGNERRAIDLSEGYPLDEELFRALVREAAELNRG